MISSNNSQSKPETQASSEKIHPILKRYQPQIVTNPTYASSQKSPQKRHVSYRPTLNFSYSTNSDSSLSSNQQNGNAHGIDRNQPLAPMVPYIQPEKHGNIAPLARFRSSPSPKQPSTTTSRAHSPLLNSKRRNNRQSQEWDTSNSEPNHAKRPISTHERTNFLNHGTQPKINQNKIYQRVHSTNNNPRQRKIKSKSFAASATCPIHGSSLEESDNPSVQTESDVYFVNYDLSPNDYYPTEENLNENNDDSIDVYLPVFVSAVSPQFTSKKHQNPDKECAASNSVLDGNETPTILKIVDSDTSNVLRCPQKPDNSTVPKEFDRKTSRMLTERDEHCPARHYDEAEHIEKPPPAYAAAVEQQLSQESNDENKWYRPKAQHDRDADKLIGSFEKVPSESYFPANSSSKRSYSPNRQQSKALLKNKSKNERIEVNPDKKTNNVDGENLTDSAKQGALLTSSNELQDSMPRLDGNPNGIILVPGQMMARFCDQNRINKMKKSKLRFCKTLSHWAGKTTLHGLNEFVSSRTMWIRIMWGTVLIGALFLMVFQITRLALKYTQHETATRVTTVPLHYYPPAVVYCTDEVFNETRLIQHNISKYMLMEILSVFYGTYQVNMSAETLDHIKASHKSLFDFLQDIGMFVFDDVLEYLMREPGDIFLNKAIYQNITKLGTPGGPCYSIKLKLSNKKSYQMERYIIPIRQAPIPPIVTEIRQKTHSISNYYHLEFGNHRVPVIINAANDAMVISTRWKRISKAAYPCRNDNENPVIDTQYCETRCEDQAMRTCFGCVFYYNTSRIKDELFCKIYMYEHMTKNATRMKCYNGFKNITENCIRDCAERKPCDEWNYEIFALPRQTRLFRYGKTTIRYLTVMIKYPYSSAYYEEHYSYMLEQFMSDLGGQLGLFFGASVLSVLQLFYFLCCIPIEKRHGMIVKDDESAAS